jgi:hypothetical protein
MYVHWRKSTNSREAKTDMTNGREERLGKFFDAGSGATFRISNWFFSRKSKQKLYIYFAL